MMGNDGAKGGCPEYPGALGKGSSEARGGSDPPPPAPPYTLGLWDPPSPGTNPGSPLILSLSKSRVWTGPLLTALPAGDLDCKSVNSQKESWVPGPLASGQWASGGGQTGEVWRGVFTEGCPRGGGNGKTVSPSRLKSPKGLRVVVAAARTWLWAQPADRG